MSADIMLDKETHVLCNTRLYDKLLASMLAKTSSSESRAKHIIKIAFLTNILSIKSENNYFMKRRLTHLLIKASEEQRRDISRESEPQQETLAYLNKLGETAVVFLSHLSNDQEEEAAPFEEGPWQLRARKHWDNSEISEAAEVIFDHIPTNVRARWATRILMLALDKFALHRPLFDKVLEIGAQESLGAAGRTLVLALQNAKLAFFKSPGMSRSKEDLATLCLFDLAMHVAEVIYNAGDPADPFDEDEGWFVVEDLNECVMRLPTDADFAEAAWSALVRCD
ncbi:MAG TPA: hypothetical protein VFE24_18475 [Pirellulales bacterium]|nr:hypothetical protein [Pirellulales bacterium]